MEFLKDESGHAAAKYTLLLGGFIVIAIAALLIYYAYFDRYYEPVAANDIRDYWC